MPGRKQEQAEDATNPSPALFASILPSSSCSRRSTPTSNSLQPQRKGRGWTRARRTGRSCRPWITSRSATRRRASSMPASSCCAAASAATRPASTASSASAAAATRTSDPQVRNLLVFIEKYIKPS